jgi:hypothetical protein
METDTIPNPKKTRCPTGTRKDPKTGNCVPMSEELIQHKKTLRNKPKKIKNSLKKSSRSDEQPTELEPSPIPVIEPIAETAPQAPQIEIESVRQPEEEKSKSVKRCPTGYRKHPKTRKCVPMSEELIQHKKTIRNKKKKQQVEEQVEEPIQEQIEEQVEEPI